MQNYYKHKITNKMFINIPKQDRFYDKNADIQHHIQRGPLGTHCVKGTH